MPQQLKKITFASLKQVKSCINLCEVFPSEVPSKRRNSLSKRSFKCDTTTSRRKGHKFSLHGQFKTNALESLKPMQSFLH